MKIVRGASIIACIALLIYGLVFATGIIPNVGFQPSNRFEAAATVRGKGIEYDRDTIARVHVCEILETARHTRYYPGQETGIFRNYGEVTASMTGCGANDVTFTARTVEGSIRRGHGYGAIFAFREKTTGQWYVVTPGFIPGNGVGVERLLNYN